MKKKARYKGMRREKLQVMNKSYEIGYKIIVFKFQFFHEYFFDGG